MSYFSDDFLPQPLSYSRKENTIPFSKLVTVVTAQEPKTKAKPKTKPKQEEQDPVKIKFYEEAKHRALSDRLIYYEVVRERVLQYMCPGPGQWKVATKTLVQATLLGSGSFGKVYLLNIPPSAAIVVKQVELKHEVNPDPREGDPLEDKEFFIANKMSNHVKMRESHYFPLVYDGRVCKDFGSTVNRGLIGVIASEVAQVSLAEVIRMFTVDMMNKLLYNVLEAIEFMHTQALVVHHDLHLQNVLIMFDWHGSWHPVITDFGFSRDLRNDKQFSEEDFMTSTRYGPRLRNDHKQHWKIRQQDEHFFFIWMRELFDDSVLKEELRKLIGRGLTPKHWNSNKFQEFYDIADKMVRATEPLSAVRSLTGHYPHTDDNWCAHYNDRLSMRMKVYKEIQREKFTMYRKVMRSNPHPYEWESGTGIKWQLYTPPPP